jgi:integrase
MTGSPNWSDSIIVPLLGTMRLDRLKPEDVQRLISRKHSEGLAPQIVHHIREGVPHKMIQELLGHSSIAVTSGFYAHLDAEFNQQGADAMDRALGEYAANIQLV